MKLIDKRKRNFPTIYISDIPMGAVFTGSISQYKGTWLRGYDILIMLEDPSVTFAGETGIKVEEYEEVEAVITIQSK